MACNRESNCAAADTSPAQWQQSHRWRALTRRDYWSRASENLESPSSGLAVADRVADADADADADAEADAKADSDEASGPAAARAGESGALVVRLLASPECCVARDEAGAGAGAAATAPVELELLAVGRGAEADAGAEDAEAAEVGGAEEVGPSAGGDGGHWAM